MAASAAELEHVRKVLNKLSAAAWGDFLAAFGDLPKWDQQIARRALEGAWPELIDTYGNMAASFGADMFEEWADSLQIRRPVVDLAEGVDPERATARAGWALSTADPMGNFKVLLDELVKQPYRSTLQDSAFASGAGWARVPTGAETCNWCLFLGSRGAVYHSRELAKYGTNGKKYHGDCDCTPALIAQDGSGAPEGYDPDALYDRYQAARQAAGSGDIRNIAAAARERFGGK